MGSLQARFRRFKRKPGSDLMLYRALVSRFSPAARDYFARLDAAGLRVTTYDAANARLIDRLVANGGNFWPDSGAFCAMAGYLFPVEDPSIPPLYNKRMYFDGVNDYVSLDSAIVLSGDFDLTWTSPITQSGKQIFFGDPDVGSNDNFVILTSLSELLVRANDNNSFITLNSALTVGETYTFRLNRTSNTYTLYIDEVAQTNTESNSSDLTIGNIGASGYAGGTYHAGTIYDIYFNDVASYQGYGNTNADWEDQIGSNDGTVNGSPALFTGQGVPGSTLIPLHPNHDAGTLNAFVTGDWNAVTGLKGDGSTKYVDSNRDNNADGQDDQAMGAYISNISGGGTLVGSGITQSGSTHLGLTFVRNRNSEVDSFASVISSSGLASMSRDNSADYIVRKNSGFETITRSSQIPLDSNIGVFGRITSGAVSSFASSRLPFYHIGPNLNGTGELAELDSILTDWQTDLANA